VFGKGEVGNYLKSQDADVILLQEDGKKYELKISKSKSRFLRFDET
jgi:hypothetical protein